MKAKKLILYLLTVTVTLSLSLGVKHSFSYLNILSSQKTNEGFEIIDFYNAVEKKLFSKHESFCNDVVIINVDACGIEELPDVIEAVNSFSPQVIGIDLLFNKHDDDIDNRLRDVIMNCGNVVVASEYDSASNQILSSPIFQNTDIPNAVVNLEKPIVRHYFPQIILGDRINSFALDLVKQYRPEKYKEQIDRGAKKKFSGIYDFTELIHIFNFSCDTIGYTTLLETNSANNNIINLLQNKIVIIGTYNDEADLHWVSNNTSLSGTFIHAAIIHTILNDYYTEEYSWLNKLLAILITTGFTWLLIFMREKYSVTGNLIIRGIQVMLLLLGILMGTILYTYGHMYIDLTITLLSVGLIYVGYDIVFGINKIIENKQNKQ